MRCARFIFRGYPRGVLSRILSVCSSLVVVVLVSATVVSGASMSTLAPGAQDCDGVCPATQSSGESVDAVDGSQPGDPEAPCVCGDGPAHAHGSSGLLSAPAARLVVFQPAGATVGDVVSRTQRPGRLTAGTESPPPRAG